MKLATKTLAKNKQECEFLREQQPRDKGVWPFNYHPVNQPWLIGACASTGLRFVCTNGVSDSGGLRCPDVSTLKNTLGDSNCMFRALSYLTTGTQRHLLLNDDLLICSTQVGVNLHYHSLSEYITETGMAENRQWGTEVELFAINHLLRTKVYAYSRDGNTWQVYSPSDIDPSLHAFESSTDMGMLHELHESLFYSYKVIFIHIHALQIGYLLEIWFLALKY